MENGPEYAANASEEGHDSTMPKVLLMGLKKSGKTSIQRVVFEKVPPHNTIFLESTTHVTASRVENTSFVKFHVLDFPGQLNFTEAHQADIFESCGCIVFVIDSSGNVEEAVQKLLDTVKAAAKVSSSIFFEVLLHKVDALSEEQQQVLFRNMSQTLPENVRSLVGDYVHLGFHLTSIYDHSIFEAFSSVIQKLIPQQGKLVELLDMFNSNSRVDKSYLFDMLSKTYIATDTSPSSERTLELCSDMIDVLVDVSSIYDDQGKGQSGANGLLEFGTANESSLTMVAAAGITGLQNPSVPSLDVNAIPEAGEPKRPAPTGFKAEEDDEDEEAEESELQSSVNNSSLPQNMSVVSKPKTFRLAFDAQSMSIMRLKNKEMLCLNAVEKGLAIVFLMKESAYNVGVIHHNLDRVRQALKELLDVQVRRVAPASQ